MKKIIALLLLCFVITNCEKDDICSSDTGTTPKLILRFYDISDEDETKQVPNLLVYGLDDASIPVLFDHIGSTASNTDSIAIPLRTDGNVTRFVLHQDFEGDFNIGNIDIITANYIGEEIYVSRACGYKTIYNNLALDVELDTENWVINSEILNDRTVKNETTAHVKIFH
jgi:hypothetical protein